MRLARRPKPFDHPDWIFELKLDGFRALAFFDGGECNLVSRNGNTFASFRNLALQLPAGLNASSAVLDGEIVSLNAEGRPQFEDLMFRRGELFFITFDALLIDGVDLRGLPLLQRKANLRAVVKRQVSRLRYLDHVEERGCDLCAFTHKVAVTES